MGNIVLTRLAQAVISGFGFNLGAMLYKEFSKAVGLPGSDQNKKPPEDPDAETEALTQDKVNVCAALPAESVAECATSDAL